MLSRKERQEYLKDLGFYDGPINGEWNDEVKVAVDKLQKKYFPKKYWDGGKYTEERTDRLLVNAWRVWKYAPHFSLTEFKCGCGGKHCSGYPAYISVQLLKNLETLRKKCGNRPIQITCGMRCKKYNDSLPGSVPKSLHRFGRAVDLYVSGTCDTEKGRQLVMSYWKQMPLYNYTYCYLPKSKVAAYNSCPNMGKAVHVDVSQDK